MTDETKSMSIIVTKGSLDWGYPPFILATTAAAMGLNVTMFFTFYGLSLLLKEFNPKVSALGNTAMKMPLGGMHVGMPNMVAAIPGVDAAASMIMKNLIKKKGVASLEDLREAAVVPLHSFIWQEIRRKRNSATFTWTRRKHHKAFCRLASNRLTKAGIHCIPDLFNICHREAKGRHHPQNRAMGTGLGKNQPMTA